MNKTTTETREAELLAMKIVNHINETVGTSVDVRQATNDEMFDYVMQIIAKEKQDLLENLLKNGHGGGNWRRLISEKLAEGTVSAVGTEQERSAEIKEGKGEK